MKLIQHLSLILSIISVAYTNDFTVAVIDFDANGITTNESIVLTNRFRDELIKLDVYTVIERNEMDEILTEQGFQQSGCVSTECVVEMGKLVGVSHIIGGSIGKVGNVFTVSARLINVENSEIESVATYDYQGIISDLLQFGMKEVVKILLGESEGKPIDELIGIGDIYVTTEPSQAVIWIDDVKMDGQTPLLLENLSAGEHSMLARKNGLSISQSITIVANEINRIALVLEAGVGRLKILSDPFDAEIYINDEFSGSTPAIVDKINSGDYQLKIKKEGYETLERVITVQPDITSTINLTLMSPQDLGLIIIPSGIYTSGSKNEKKTIVYEYYISKFEITNLQYCFYLNSEYNAKNIKIYNGKIYGTYSGDERSKKGKYLFINFDHSKCQIQWNGVQFTIDDYYNDFPIIPITWYGAHAYAKWSGGRLPTAKEWEKAARGDTGNDYPWGNQSPTCDLANHRGCGGEVVAVGLKHGASPYGLYDMAGNAREWISDYYFRFGKHHATMGGGVNSLDTDLKSYKKTNLTDPAGFRIVKDIE